MSPATSKSPRAQPQEERPPVCWARWAVTFERLACLLSENCRRRTRSPSGPCWFFSGCRCAPSRSLSKSFLPRTVWQRTMGCGPQPLHTWVPGSSRMLRQHRISRMILPSATLTQSQRGRTKGLATSFHSLLFHFTGWLKAQPNTEGNWTSSSCILHVYPGGQPDLCRFTCLRRLDLLW